MLRRSILLTAVVAALSLAPFTQAHGARPSTWTLTPGGPWAGVALNHVFGSLVRARSDIAGIVQAGSGMPGNGAWNISSFGLSGCSTAGIDMSDSISGLPASINLTGMNEDRVDVVIPGLRFDGSSGDGLCAFTVEGVNGLTGHYDNSTAELALTGGDLIVVAADCLGIVNPGDSFPVDAVYRISPHLIFTQD